VFYESTERNKQVIKEIEYNLFKLTSKTSKSAYAKVILCDIDKSRIHNLKVTDCIRESKLKEFFEQVLNKNLISKSTNKISIIQATHVTTSKSDLSVILHFCSNIIIFIKKALSIKLFTPHYQSD
jgi:UDP-glucose 6-dehydrogenase